MTRAILIAPTSPGVGLISALWGVFRALENQGVRTTLFKPFAKDKEHAKQWSNQDPLTIAYIERMLAKGEKDKLLEEIVEKYEKQKVEGDVVVIHGLVATSTRPYATMLNSELAQALDASVILVASPKNYSAEQLSEELSVSSKSYINIIGCIINKVGGPVDEKGLTRLDLSGQVSKTRQNVCSLIKAKLIGCIPWDHKLIAPRIKDIATFLDAKVLFEGEMAKRRVMAITLCAQTVNHLDKALAPGMLIITPADRSDIILAVCMAAINGIEIAGLILTGEHSLDPKIKQLCEKALEGGLPILSVPTNSFETALRLQNLNMQVPLDDQERLELVKNEIATHIQTEWIQTLLSKSFEPHLSPAAFRYQLAKKAKAAKKTILLPEGNEPRIIRAATLCGERGLAKCILLGNKEEILDIAQKGGLSLPDSIQILDPEKELKKYITPLVKLRSGKGVTEVIAKEQLQDPVVLATMMLKEGVADGLVSGAVNTTANTIRPALQIIKTAPNSTLVSSIFFMLLKDQVVVYGDCAVNPNPTAEQLAEIAIQSADSAKAFGIDPRVAMISYSSGSSGKGADVEKVIAATKLVKEKRPDLTIDGPLQYDTASTKSVAQKKAPESPVAGKATVFIFPDLNTGNTTYKAVQRSADVLSVGPMLQGLARPVNDLSRGASVDDILFTIALSAIQSDIQPL